MGTRGTRRGTRQPGVAGTKFSLPLLGDIPASPPSSVTIYEGAALDGILPRIASRESVGGRAQRGTTASRYGHNLPRTLVNEYEVNLRP